jgi:hypothetical protein
VKASDIVALPLQLGSAIRHRRVFHPLGVLAEGHLRRTAPVGEGLPVESADILGRVSKAVDVPGSLPDLVGLAWRIPPPTPAKTPWDVLLVSAGSGLLTRFVLRPTSSWTGTTLTTLMPLRHGNDWWWVRAELKSQVAEGLSLADVSAAIAGDGIVFDVTQARGTGPFLPLATLELTKVIPTDEKHDVSFDPTRNSAPGVGLGPQWLTTLRERAYLRSRRGRHAPPVDHPATR